MPSNPLNKSSDDSQQAHDHTHQLENFVVPDDAVLCSIAVSEAEAHEWGAMPATDDELREIGALDNE